MKEVGRRVAAWEVFLEDAVENRRGRGGWVIGEVDFRGGVEVGKQ